MDKLKNFQEDALLYIQSNDLSSINDNINNILIPFIKLLNYDIDSKEIISNPRYIQEEDEFFDFGLKEDLTSDNFKILIKVLPFGSNLEDFEDLIDKVLKIDNNVEYIILTNTVDMLIYEINEFNYELLSKINIVTLYQDNELDGKTKSDLLLIEKLSKNNSLSFFGEKEDNKKEKENPFKKVKLSLKSVLLGLLAFLTILMLLVGSILKKRNNKDIKGNSNNKTSITHEEKSKNDLEDLLGGLNNSITNNVAYIDLKPNLNLDMNASTKKLIINLKSDIVDGAKIKYEIINGDNHSIVYDTILNNSSSLLFDIPENWKNPLIQVVAYLRFDETGEYKQPDNVINLYGNDGENIIKAKNANKYGLTFAEIGLNGEKKDRNLTINMQEVNISGYESVSDALGNYRIKPKGFEMDKVNIRENRNIYPEIIYNAKEDRVYLQVVFGILDTQWKMFDKIGFVVDGNTWLYEVSNNAKKRKVAGIDLAEWAYFNNYDNPRLFKDMQLLSNSNEAKIIFTGASKKEHIVTEEEKELLRYFIQLYTANQEGSISLP